ncbi:MAG: hypothetical protein KAJ91_02650, partial [Candidatus Aenigmarchaeota archaeon]|nr:hypothetical protein [Candidatus Aenigmarchaeota archaeon]
TGGDDPDDPDPEDELVVPVPAVEGTMVIDTLGDRTGSCDVETDITVKVTEGAGITEYTFDAILSKDEIKLTCTSTPCTGEITTESLGTISLVNNDEREARISFTYDNVEDECTFSSSIYDY